MAVKTDWINDEELENVAVKWNWSHFDGNDPMSQGERSFTAILDKETAQILADRGWTSVKENAPYEEGDEPEYTMKIKASWKIAPPSVFFIKNGRKFRIKEEDLTDIRRDTCEQIDVIINPSRWKNMKGEEGITAYVKEMYVTIRESRFGAKYADLDEH